MKISSLYLNDVSNYEDIVQYMTNTIMDKFYGIGKNSIAFTKLITFIKKSIKIYIRLKYQKNIKVIISFPTSDSKIVYHDNYSDTNLVRIRLQYDIINSILYGECNNLEEYISDIFEQLETEITNDNKFSFSEYLTIQMDSMVQIAKIELNINNNRDEIIKRENWLKFSLQSSVFNDYYKLYLESPSNKKLFYTFLKNLIKI
jgi:hypothetical protein